MRPLEQAVVDLATSPDRFFGFDLAPFKMGIRDACARIEALEAEIAQLKTAVADKAQSGVAGS